MRQEASRTQHMTASTGISVDKIMLEQKVKSMYRDVALNPRGKYHFEMGYDLALRLGYTKTELESIPRPSIDSFAGVGYHFGLAEIKAGDKVLEAAVQAWTSLLLRSTLVTPDTLPELI